MAHKDITFYSLNIIVFSLQMEFGLKFLAGADVQFQCCRCAEAQNLLGNHVRRSCVVSLAKYKLFFRNIGIFKNTRLLTIYVLSDNKYYQTFGTRTLEEEKKNQKIKWRISFFLNGL